jgi:hypothetical protein
VFQDTEDLLDEYDRLRRETSSHVRGRALEGLVRRLFRLNHFEVTENPGAAKPRQTDLLARDASRTYLVEVTSQSRAVDIDAIDGLFTRLDDTPTEVRGGFVSLAGFSGTATERVESKRNRSVLLITGDELESLLASPSTLRQVLERKYDMLLTHRKALIEVAGISRSPSGERFSLTRGPREFLFPNKTAAEYLRGGGGFGSFVFVHHLFDIDWVTAPGAGVSVDFPVRFEDEKGLAKVLDEFTAIGWTSENGCWSIHQSDSNWHGFGTSGFLSALDGWRKRYRSAGRIHHTEEAVYYDECEGGFYTIVASLDTRNRWARSIDISLQLTGIPLDEGPLRRLHKALGVQGQAYLRPRVEKSVSTKHFVRDSWTPVDPTALVVQRQTWPDGKTERWVSGIVVPNPFKEKPDQDATPDWWPWSISESELMVCSLGSWHTVGDRHGGYYIKRFEWAWTSDAYVFRAVADWLDPELRRGRPRRES